MSPEATTSRCTITGAPRPMPKRSRPNGTGPEPSSAARASADMSARRNSRLAVRPMMSLALAVSCTPGNCTTTRSAPCCWITGSATPSSLTRLCSVVMFCCSACSWTRRAASGLSVPVELAVGCRRRLRSTAGRPSDRRAAAAPASASRASRKRIVDAVAVARDAGVADVLCRAAGCAGRRRTTRPSSSAPPACRPASGSARRRAGRGPRYIGSARRLASHCGERDSRFSATM